ncbi:unnamed protein product [Pieris macdunnoughi]|uniref:Uncharacterized protein n=1 Tax=Pieris macdunnoughi TaxID=345717 RepID=A0A821THE2_9NEOP|nr:unnamed protein product [Pieris macdunnoughi]
MANAEAAPEHSPRRARSPAKVGSTKPTRASSLRPTSRHESPIRSLRSLGEKSGRAERSVGSPRPPGDANRRRPSPSERSSLEAPPWSPPATPD